MITDCATAVELATRWERQFTARTEQTLETAHARYASFTPEGADRDALVVLLALELLPAEPSWVVLRRYRPGDYALPHPLRAELEDAAQDIRWSLVCPLTESSVDGVTIWNGECFIRLLDHAGRAVAASPDSWCWTSPVHGSTRYTVTLGGGDA